MKTVIGAMALLLLVGLMAVPAMAGELRVTGFIDSAISVDQNISGNSAEFNVTSNKDNATLASTRSQLFFNFIASDDLRGIFAIELDQAWGACAACRAGSDALTQSQSGFSWNIDNNNFELKQLYVDFRIPQLPFGNRWRVGGPRFQATPLHTNLLVSNDAGGADVTLNFSPEVSLLLYYVQIEEDSERSPLIVTKVGEDYMTGATLMLKPLPGWDLHLPIVYQHLHAPFGSAISGGQGTPFSGTQTPKETVNIATEDRYWLGFDSRYRLGNLSIEPSFFYLTGTRKFCTPGSTIAGGPSDTVGGGATDAAVACTSPTAGGIQEIDINAFGALLQLNYVMGKWLLSVQGVYTSGDDASADLNNQGVGAVGSTGRGRTRDDSGHFRIPGAETAHWTKWLSILGNSDYGDGRHDISPFRLGEGANIGLDRFGYVSGAGKVEHKLTDKLLLRGVVGTVFAAKTPACPAVQRTGTVTSTNPTGCTDLRRNWTGDSKYLGTEVDVFLDWSIMPGLLNRIGGGYAFLGDALETNNGKVQNAWMILNRLLYAF